MNVDGAENAKAEVFLRAFKYGEVPTASLASENAPTFAPLAGTGAHADIVRARREGTFDAKEKIAVGILRHQESRAQSQDLKLGLFIQHKKLLHHPVVENARRIANGEIEVVVTGRVRHHAAGRVRLSRPLGAGESVGHHRITAGTIGCFGVDQNGGIGIVSNNHVLADTNRGRPKDIILQPGRADGGDIHEPTHHVAKLESHVEIDFDPSASNLVDCAFALLDPTVACQARRIGEALMGPEAWDIREIDDLILPGNPVKKIGRTTGKTEGTIEAIGVDNVRVQMVTGARPKFAVFNQQVAFGGSGKTFSKGGDSGALICTMDGKPVALLFAGSESGGREGRGITFGNPIRTVLDALEIELYTGPAGG